MVWKAAHIYKFFKQSRKVVVLALSFCPSKYTGWPISSLTQNLFTCQRKCSKCSPWADMQSSRRWRTLFVTFRQISEVIFLHSEMMRSRNSSNVLDFCLNTWFFKWPQRKKSRGVRSGDRAGHSIGPLQPSHRSGNLLSSHCLTINTYCRGAPSCWKWNSLKFTRFSAAGRNCCCNISRWFCAFTVPSKKNERPTSPSLHIPCLLYTSPSPRD